MDQLRTSLCDLLKIEYPILQSGMGSVAGPELVAEVSRAGGLGILAGLRLYAAATQQQNREYFPMHAGQSVGLVHDLPGAAEVVETLVREGRAALRALGERVHLG